MYRLSADVDLRFLKGREVQQVAIGVYQVQFVFDEDVPIYVYSQFAYFDGHLEWFRTPEPGSAQIASRATALLRATVASYQGQTDGT